MSGQPLVVVVVVLVDAVVGVGILLVARAPFVVDFFKDSSTKIPFCSGRHPEGHSIRFNPGSDDAMQNARNCGTAADILTHTDTDTASERERERLREPNTVTAP